MDVPLAEQIASGPFQPTLESLYRYRCPQWFSNAKFGIWSHWGPQSVPMAGDWYARQLYEPDHPHYLHHWRTYGHPSLVGYKDLLPLWKAERFDPDALMTLYQAAGACYFVAQAVHHDNFDNWESTHHRWNAAAMGPKRDIVRLWRDAARRRNLPFGVSEHLGAAFTWWRSNKGADADGPHAGLRYDGADPENADLYLPNAGEPDAWYTANPDWHRHWFERIKDLLDQHHPDLLYSDGGLPFGEYGRAIVAHLYNLSAAMHGGACEAVYTQKDTDPAVYRVGVLDIERGQRGGIAEHPWQTDTCVGGWFYDLHKVYKKPGHVIETLVDIVSKNGNLLLNIPQRPDGTLDEECRWLLGELAEWFKHCGEAVHGTRPWRVPGEGPSVSREGAFNEEAVAWTSEDFRFTTRGEHDGRDGVVYAFQMRYSDDLPSAITQLGLDSGLKVSGVRMLGHGSVRFSQTESALVLLPADARPVRYVPCYAVTFV